MENASNIINDIVYKNILNKENFKDFSRIEKSRNYERYNTQKIRSSITDSSMRESTTILNSSEIEPYRQPKDQIRQLIGKSDKYPETIGAHPDFKYLKNGETEYHYINSVFVDIKGSTKLATKLSLEEVRHIKNGTLITIIDVFHAFNGHIHRLQGDAVFAFFGRRNQDKSNAIIDAINAVSFLQYLFSSLQEKFEEIGLPRISIRVGMDFGDTEKVLWSRYGLYNTDEITTTSIHTDLAAKLQNKAPANGIAFGENVREYIDLPEEFYFKRTFTENGNKKDDDYIIRSNGFDYKMWIFNWNKYINTFLFLTDRESTKTYKSPNDFIITLHYEKDGVNTYYPPNCGALEKGIELTFRLEIKPYVKCDTILWEVNNRGDEAERDGTLKFSMDDFKNKKYCEQRTAFKGHHYMICTLQYQGRVVGLEKYGVYVKG